MVHQGWTQSERDCLDIFFSHPLVQRDLPSGLCPWRKSRREQSGVIEILGQTQTMTFSCSEYLPSYSYPSKQITSRSTLQISVCLLLSSVERGMIPHQYVLCQQIPKGVTQLFPKQSAFLSAINRWFIICECMTVLLL